MAEKAKKKASKPSKPSCFEMVVEAIKAKKGTFGKGVSRSFIYKKIGEMHSGTQMAAVRRAISKGLEDGSLAVGSTKQRFKLTDAGKAKVAPPKPKKKKKKAKKKVSKKKRKKTTKRKTSKKRKAKKKTSKRKASKSKRKSSKRSSSKRKAKRRTSKKRRASTK